MTTPTRTPFTSQVSVRGLNLATKPVIQVRPRLSILLGTVGDLQALGGGDSLAYEVSFGGFSCSDEEVNNGTSPFPLIEIKLGESLIRWALVRDMLGSHPPLVSGSLRTVSSSDVIEVSLLDDGSGFDVNARVDVFFNVRIV